MLSAQSEDLLKEYIKKEIKSELLKEGGGVLGTVGLIASVPFILKLVNFIYDKISEGFIRKAYPDVFAKSIDKRTLLSLIDGDSAEDIVSRDDIIAYFEDEHAYETRVVRVKSRKKRRGKKKAEYRKVRQKVVSKSGVHKKAKEVIDFIDTHGMVVAKFVNHFNDNETYHEHSRDHHHGDNHDHSAPEESTSSASNQEKRNTRHRIMRNSKIPGVRAVHSLMMIICAFHHAMHLIVTEIFECAGQFVKSIAELIPSVKLSDSFLKPVGSLIFAAFMFTVVFTSDSHGPTTAVKITEIGSSLWKAGSTGEILQILESIMSALTSLPSIISGLKILSQAGLVSGLGYTAKGIKEFYDFIRSFSIKSNDQKEIEEALSSNDPEAIERAAKRGMMYKKMSAVKEPTLDRRYYQEPGEEDYQDSLKVDHHMINALDLLYN